MRFIDLKKILFSLFFILSIIQRTYMRNYEKTENKKSHLIAIVLYIGSAICLGGYFLITL